MVGRMFAGRAKCFFEGRGLNVSLRAEFPTRVGFFLLARGRNLQCADERLESKAVL